MVGRDEDAAQPQQQLRQKQNQHGNVGKARSMPYPGIRKPAVQQHYQPHEAHHARNTADRHGQKLLGGMGDAKRLENKDGRQQPACMAQEDHQDADMKQIAAPDQLAAAQKLAGLAAPAILLAVEADDAADQADRDADVRIDPEQEAVDCVRHASAPLPVILRRIASARGHPSVLASPGPKRTSASSQARSTAARSLGSSSGTLISSATASGSGWAAAMS